jgi:peptidoglycan biosynthesis protein MviN/MurJ (putative lipid II flippase)
MYIYDLKKGVKSLYPVRCTYKYEVCTCLSIFLFDLLMPKGLFISIYMHMNAEHNSSEKFCRNFFFNLSVIQGKTLEPF